MADGTMERSAAIRARVGEAEWGARVELAALYRLVALYGWDDAVFTHLSLVIPGTDRILINPYGMFFEEMTARALLAVDLDGRLLDDPLGLVDQGFEFNADGFAFHAAVHRARADALCVVHLHTRSGVAVSAQTQGLMPLTQNALLLQAQLAYHDYEGLSLDDGEEGRLVAALGDRNLMVLNNHGTLVLGRDPAEAWLRTYVLERACTQQIDALTAGGDGVRQASQASRDRVALQTKGRGPGGRRARMAWAGFLRRLDRALPGYDT